VILAPDSLAIQTRAYQEFDDFLERLRQVLEALVEHIRPSIGMRLGLRYVNEIRANRLPWDEVISPELLGPLREPGLRQHAATVSSVQQVLLRYENHQGINIQHGLFPQGTTVQPRIGVEPDERAFYLLDFDVFRDSPRPGGIQMAPGVLCQDVGVYHSIIHRLFRWAVTDNYVETLEERRHAGH
jgi:uncharacterized protein (TIGR04255 family)